MPATRKSFYPSQGLARGLIIANLAVFLLLFILVALDLYPSAKNYLLSSVTESMTEHSYSLDVTETGENYTIFFEGGMTPAGELSGKIEDFYNMVLYMKSDHLYMASDINDWAPVEEMEMESLYALLYNPFKALEEMVAVERAVIVYGPQVNLNGRLSQRVDIRLPYNNLEAFTKKYFALEDGTPCGIIAMAWVDCVTNKLTKMEMRLVFAYDNQEMEICRVIEMEPGGAVPVVDYTEASDSSPEK